MPVFAAWVFRQIVGVPVVVLRPSRSQIVGVPVVVPTVLANYSATESSLCAKFRNLHDRIWER